jgi:hypothetical protein
MPIRPAQIGANRFISPFYALSVAKLYTPNCHQREPEDSENRQVSILTLCPVLNSHLRNGRLRTYTLRKPQVRKTECWPTKNRPQSVDYLR